MPLKADAGNSYAFTKTSTKSSCSIFRKSNQRESHILYMRQQYLDLVSKVQERQVWQEDPKMSKMNEFFRACERGDLKAIEKFVPRFGVDGHDDNFHTAIQVAAANDQVRTE